MCIGGLVIFITSSILLSYEYRLLGNQNYNLYARISSLQERVSQLKAKVEKNPNDNHSFNNGFSDNVDNYSLELVNLESERKYVDFANRRLMYEISFLEYTRYLVGLFVMLGYIMWYIKLQRYLDRNVKNR